MNPKSLTAGAALVLAATTSLYGQAPFSLPGTGQPPSPPTAPKPAGSAPAPAPAPAPGEAPKPAADQPDGFETIFGVRIPEAIAKGKFNLNSRLRFEYVDQDGAPGITEPSYAPTLRTRFGYTTAPLYGFQGMLEGENITVIGPEDNFNAAGSNGTGYKPVVADPPTTELNQAWLSYNYTNWITAKVGRQRIALDNHRFVGDVAWRQNMQTFDAVTAEGKPLPGLNLFYGYIWDVRRVFGNVDGLPANNTDFQSASHLINVSYTGWKYARFVGYSYLLDLHNEAGYANSSATYGGYVAGATPVSDKISINYRGEVAFQTDYADNPQEYQAEYYNAELGAAIKPVAFGGGYEVLGTDSNDAGPGGVGFKTPLATLHAFNGWNDVFLATPSRGLRDAYGYVQVDLPAQIPLRGVFHKYDADSGGADFGHEFNVQATRKFGKYWSALLKYGYYDGEDAPSAYTLHKFWAQVEFNF
jgi:hypothetical protein